MSALKHPAEYKLQNDKGHVVSQGKFPVPGTKEFKGLNPGECTLTFSSESNITPNPIHCYVGENTTWVVTVRDGIANFSEDFVEDASDDRVKDSSNLGFWLAASLVGILGVGTGMGRAPNSPNVPPSSINSPYQVNAPSKSGSSNGTNQSNTASEPGAMNANVQPRTASSESELGAKVRKCLKANFQKLSGISELSDLVKERVLTEVTDEKIAKDVVELHGKVDRLRQILQGCDPELVHQLIEAKSRETSSAQSHSTARIPENLSQPFRSIVIFACNGRPGSAYFRSDPTLAEWAIWGVVEQGEQVYLTGGTYEDDGGVWYEAIAPSALTDAGKQISPNQVGWIAGCFVQ